MDIIYTVLTFVGFALAIILHEVAHGAAADKLGDPTARLMGRLTLNPIPHIDLFGSIIVPLVFYLSNLNFIFGWAKPVSVDPYNLKDPKKDMALISLAGPLTNIAFAILLSIFLRILMIMYPQAPFFDFFVNVIGINLVIAVFNLVPIFPTDGGKILVGLLPRKQSQELDVFFNKFGMAIFFLLILPIFGGVSLVSTIIFPIITFALNLLIPGVPTL